jgi:xylulokinase
MSEHEPASVLSTLGVDLGTGGARALVVDPEGGVVASGRAPLATGEPDAEAWWRAAREAIRAAASSEVGALCVSATSGTVVGVDAHGRPTTRASYYNEVRAEEEAELRAFAGGAALSALARLRWFERHRPHELEATATFAHQADFVVGRLTGRFGVSDASNALKTGYDLRARAWPAWLDELPALRARLPEVVAPGTVLGEVRGAVADELGLPRGTAVVAGVTDGTAAFLASGATRVGDDNTTLGTTLVFKRLAARPPEDAAGALTYSHALGGRWLPGAASNTGGEWLRSDHPGADLAALDAAAAERLPTDHAAYPLRASGERFPFRSATAEGFCEPPADDPVTRYAAHLEGTAYVERLAYEVLGATDGDVFATGGGSRSEVWMQLRADVTGRALHRPVCPEAAFGSAVLAAAGSAGTDLWDACRQRVRVERTFAPRPERHAAYAERYACFRGRLEERGYL